MKGKTVLAWRMSTAPDQALFAATPSRKSASLSQDSPSTCREDGMALSGPLAFCDIQATDCRTSTEGCAHTVTDAMISLLPIDKTWRMPHKW